MCFWLASTEQGAHLASSDVKKKGTKQDQVKKFSSCCDRPMKIRDRKRGQTIVRNAQVNEHPWIIDCCRVRKEQKWIVQSMSDGD